MKRYFYLLSVLFNLLVTGSTYAQKSTEGFNIKFEIQGLKDTVAHLGYYYGEGTYLKDSAKVDNQGRFNFTGKEKLPQGVYFVVLNRTQLFDFLVPDEQHFSIKSNSENYITNLESPDNLDNQVFSQQVNYIIQNKVKVQPYITILKDSTANDSKKSLAREKLEEVDLIVEQYQDSIIAKYPDLLAIKIIQAQQNVKIPTTDAYRNDKQLALDYVRAHYWDKFDLSNEAFLRFPQPLYRQKVDYYLDKLFMQHADSLIAEISPLIAQAKTNPETYKYLVWNLILNYQYPKIMGLDKIFVHLYDEYFASGEMDYWADEQLKKNLNDRATLLRNSLIGSKAPDLTIQDLDNAPQNLYKINNKYTVIYFYDPDCGFCKKETPKLRDFSNSTKNDVAIYAVCADSSLTKMSSYINDMEISHWINVNGPRTYTVHYKQLYDAETTPTIYLLDEKKKIIAKKIGAGKLEEFISNYEQTTNR